MAIEKNNLFAEFLILYIKGKDLANQQPKKTCQQLISPFVGCLFISHYSPDPKQT